MRRFLGMGVLAACVALVGCVQRDPATGDVRPPGNQKYTYSDVKQRAKRLQPGMTRIQVMVLLGSPAKEKADEWIYLPDVSLPLGEALHVYFDRGVLVKHSFKPIIISP